jgi:hypothetical protein
MRTLKCISSVTVIAVGMTAWVFAQGGARRGGGNYNTATEITFSGTVEEVQHMPAPGRGPGGLHLIVRSDAGAYDVHLGPMAYITSKNFAFAKDDAITVTGSRVTMDGKDVVIAREVKKGDRVLTLRDANGFPLWSGRGRRSS